jgi:hypothetical protein
MLLKKFVENVEIAQKNIYNNKLIIDNFVDNLWIRFFLIFSIPFSPHIVYNAIRLKHFRG